MGYYCYFILLAHKFLKDSGVFGFIIPAAFLSTKNAQLIRDLLLDEYHIRYIISNNELTFSESTWRREILLIAQKSKIKKETQNHFQDISIIY